MTYAIPDGYRFDWTLGLTVDSRIVESISNAPEKPDSTPQDNNVCKEEK